MKVLTGGPGDFNTVSIRIITIQTALLLTDKEVSIQRLYEEATLNSVMELQYELLPRKVRC